MFDSSTNYSCKLCGNFSNSGHRHSMYRHLFYSHYYKYFVEYVSDSIGPPFVCPMAKCEKQNASKDEMVHHYALNHQKQRREIFELYEKAEPPPVAIAEKYAEDVGSARSVMLKEIHLDGGEKAKITDSVEALEIRLREAKTFQEEIVQSDRYMDDRTFTVLSSQLEVMKMEKKYAKAKAIKDEIDELIAGYRSLLMNKNYLCYSKIREMEMEINEMRGKIEDLKLAMQAMTTNMEEMEDGVKQAKNINGQIGVFHDQKKRKRNSVDFLDEESLQQLAKEIDAKKKRLETQDVKRGNSVTVDKSDMECVVCLEIPIGNVKACVECVNIICQKCTPKLTECPTCRVNVAQTPLIRNRMLERMLQKM